MWCTTTFWSYHEMHFMFITRHLNSCLSGQRCWRIGWCWWYYQDRKKCKGRISSTTHGIVIISVANIIILILILVNACIFLERILYHFGRFLSLETDKLVTKVNGQQATGLEYKKRNELKMTFKIKVITYQRSASKVPQFTAQLYKKQ